MSSIGNSDRLCKDPIPGFIRAEFQIHAGSEEGSIPSISFTTRVDASLKKKKIKMVSRHWAFEAVSQDLLASTHP